MVGEDNELSHEGSESEFFGFAASEETEVDGSEDRIEAEGDERGHVKDRANLRAAAEDVALSAQLTAVVVKWGDTGQGGGLGKVRIGGSQQILTDRVAIVNPKVPDKTRDLAK